MALDRNYRIDFLRALSMFLIVVQHYVVWGVKQSSHAVFNVNSISGLCNYTIMEGLYLLSCIGVNCFIMISGYFMINRYQYRWNSLIRLWITTVFYSVILYIISVYLSGSSIDKHALIECIVPIWSKQYWFISMYFGLMLIAPFLSLVATQISKKSYQFLLMIMFAMSFMIPYGKLYAGSTSIMWLSFVYLMAGYIRLHGVPNVIASHIKLISLMILILYSLGIAFSEFFMHTDFSNMAGTYQLHSLASDSPIFFLSLAIFIWTIQESHKSNCVLKWSVRISPFILAVYLIHMNKYLYIFIWQLIIPETYHIPMAFHAIISCAMIFLICIIVDYLRNIIFKFILIDSAIKKLSSYIKLKEIETNV